MSLFWWRRRESDLSRVRAAIVFKNFASWTGISHIGLNVAALTNARVLSQNGIRTVVFPVRNNIDVVDAINEYRDEHELPLSHVIISAPWLSRYDMLSIIEEYPNIQFVIESHSNVGFLQADPWAVRLLRDAIELAETHDNVRVGGNSSRFVDWMKLVYDPKTVLLPNLYPLYPIEHDKRDCDSPIKVGLFGAVRPQKNFMTAAGGAIAMQRILRKPLEIHMTEGGEGDGGSVARAITQMCVGLSGITLIRHSWKPWEDFIEEVGEMDLLMTPSYTESFNMVTADGILMGVPSVVSSSIAWAPENWKADSDDVMDVARVGLNLLAHREREAHRGHKILAEHNERGLESWKAYFDSTEDQ